MNEKFIRDIFRMVKMKCKECGNYYNEEDIEIIENDDGSCFLNIYCRTCDRRSFAIALTKREEQNDISDSDGNEESVQITPSVPIETDDVIDIHTFLKDFDGDFAGLFGQEDLQQG
jgi:hypothetical protein